MRTPLHQPVVRCGDRAQTISHQLARKFRVRDGQEVDEQTFSALTAARGEEARAFYESIKLSIPCKN